MSKFVVQYRGRSATLEFEDIPPFVTLHDAISADIVLQQRYDDGDADDAVEDSTGSAGFALHGKTPDGRAVEITGQDQLRRVIGRLGAGSPFFLNVRDLSASGLTTPKESIEGSKDSDAGAPSPTASDRGRPYSDSPTAPKPHAGTPPRHSPASHSTRPAASTHVNPSPGSSAGSQPPIESRFARTTAAANTSTGPRSEGYERELRWGQPQAARRNTSPSSNAVGNGQSPLRTGHGGQPQSQCGPRRTSASGTGAGGSMPISPLRRSLSSSGPSRVSPPSGSGTPTAGGALSSLGVAKAGAINYLRRAAPEEREAMRSGGVDAVAMVDNSSNPRAGCHVLHTHKVWVGEWDTGRISVKDASSGDERFTIQPFHHHAGMAYSCTCLLAFDAKAVGRNSHVSTSAAEGSGSNDQAEARKVPSEPLWKTAVWAGFTSKHVKVYACKDGAELATMSEHLGPVTSLTSVSGFVFSSSIDFQILQWDPETFAVTRQLSGHSNGVRGLSIGPLNRLVSVSDDQSIILWHQQTGDMLHQETAAHDVGIHAVAAKVNEKARTIVASPSTVKTPVGHMWTGDERGTVKSWTVLLSGGKLSLALAKAFPGAHTRAVISIHVLARKVVTSGQEGTCIVFDGGVKKRLLGSFTHSPQAGVSTVVNLGPVIHSLWTGGGDKRWCRWSIEDTAAVAGFTTVVGGGDGSSTDDDEDEAARQLAEAESEAAALRDEVARMDDEISRLSYDAERQRKMAEDEAADADAAKASLKKARADAAKLHAALNQEEQVRMDLESKLLASNAEAADLRNTLNATNAEFEKVKKDRTALRKERDALDSSVRETETEGARVRDEMARLRSQASEMKRALAEARGAADAAQEELAATRQHGDNTTTMMQQQLTKQKELCEETQRNLDLATATALEFRELQARTQEELDKAKVSAQSHKQRAESVSEELGGESAALQRRLVDATDEVAELQARQEQLRSELVNAKNDQQTADDKCTSVSKDLAAERELTETLRADLAKAKKEASDAAASATATAQRGQDLESQLSEVTDRLEHHNDKSRNSLASAEQQLQVLESNYEQLRQASDAAALESAERRMLDASSAEQRVRALLEEHALTEASFIRRAGLDDARATRLRETLEKCTAELEQQREEGGQAQARSAGLEQAKEAMSHAFDQERKESDAVVKSLEAQLAQSKEISALEVARLAQQLQDRETALAQSRAREAELTESYAKAKSDATALRAERDAHEAAMGHQRHVAGSEKDRLEGQYQSIASQLSVTQKELLAARETEAAAETARAAAVESLMIETRNKQELEAEISRLNELAAKRREEAEQRTRVMEAGLEASREGQRGLQAQMDTLQAENAKLFTKAEELRVGQDDAVEQQTALLRAQLDDLRQRSQATSAELSEKHRALLKAEAEIAALKHDSAEATRGEMDALRAELDKSSHTVRALEAERSTMMPQLDASRKRAVEVEERLRTAEAALRKMQLEHESAGGARDDAVTAKDHMHRSLTQAMEDHTAQLAALGDANRSLEAKADKATADAAAANARASRAESDAVVAGQRVKETEARMSEAEAAADDAERRLREADARCAAAIAGCDQNVASLVAECTELRGTTARSEAHARAVVTAAHATLTHIASSVPTVFDVVTDNVAASMHQKTALFIESVHGVRTYGEGGDALTIASAQAELRDLRTNAAASSSILAEIAEELQGLRQRLEREIADHEETKKQVLLARALRPTDGGAASALHTELAVANNDREALAAEVRRSTSQIPGAVSPRSGSPSASHHGLQSSRYYAPSSARGQDMSPQGGHLSSAVISPQHPDQQARQTPGRCSTSPSISARLLSPQNNTPPSYTPVPAPTAPMTASPYGVAAVHSAGRSLHGSVQGSIPRGIAHSPSPAALSSLGLPAEYTPSTGRALYPPEVERFILATRPEMVESVAGLMRGIFEATRILQPVSNTPPSVPDLAVLRGVHGWLITAKTRGAYVSRALLTTKEVQSIQMD